MIVDPWGKVLADCGAATENDVDGDGVVAGAGVVKVAAIDLQRLRKIRREMPIWNHRREDVYGKLEARFYADQTSTTIEKNDSVSSPSYRFGPNVTLSPGVVFHETPLSFAFVNRKPVLPGHVLIAPKRLVPRMKDVRKPFLRRRFGVGLRLDWTGRNR